MSNASVDPIRSIDDRVRLSTLPGGLRIVTDPVPNATSVALGCWVEVGSRDEDAAVAGASHFMEHLLFKGTQRRSANQVNAAIDAVGGELNAFTTKEHTAFYTRVPADALGLGFELLGEILTMPAMEQRHVEIEREVILEELAMVNDNPDELVFSVLNERMFPDHPLGWEVLGQESTLEALRREDLVSFFEEWYGCRNLVVTAAGAVDHDHLCDLAAERFAGRNGAGSHARNAPAPLEPSRTVLDRETEQVHLALGWRGLHHRDPDRFALAVLDHLVGDGPSSRLFREIRDERGLAYSVFMSHSGVSDAGAMSLYCGTSPENLAQVRELIDHEIDRIRTEPVAPEELEMALGYLCGSMVLGLEDHGGRMSLLAGGLSAHGEVIPIGEVLDSIRAVTADDVMRVGERLFSSAPAEVVIGGT